MTFDFRSKNTRKIEELEKEIKSLSGSLEATKNTVISTGHKVSNIENNLGKEVKFTKERFIEYIDKRTTIYTKFHEELEEFKTRLKKIESIGDFEMLMKRVAHIESQFGPIMGNVTDTFSSAMQALITEAGKTNQYMSGLVRDAFNDDYKQDDNNKKLVRDHTIKIIINGAIINVYDIKISYNQICELADWDTDPFPTITYSNGINGEEGELLSGGDLLLNEGITINVHDTNNA